MNYGVRADFLPDRFPDLGQCPHKVLAAPGGNGVLYQQDHCGVFRCGNGGKDWQDITQDLPSSFGFVLGLHSTDPDTLFVLPEDQAVGEDTGGGMRYVSEGRFRVFRSRNGGQDWEPLTNGLPQGNSYLHALREGMSTDAVDPAGFIWERPPASFSTAVTLAMTGRCWLTNFRPSTQWTAGWCFKRWF